MLPPEVLLFRGMTRGGPATSGGARGARRSLALGRLSRLEIERMECLRDGPVQQLRRERAVLSRGHPRWQRTTESTPPPPLGITRPVRYMTVRERQCCSATFVRKATDTSVLRMMPTRKNPSRLTEGIGMVSSAIALRFRVRPTLLRAADRYTYRIGIVEALLTIFLPEKRADTYRHREI